MLRTGGTTMRMQEITEESAATQRAKLLKASANREKLRAKQLGARADMVTAQAKQQEASKKMQAAARGRGTSSAE